MQSQYDFDLLCPRTYVLVLAGMMFCDVSLQQAKLGERPEWAERALSSSLASYRDLLNVFHHVVCGLCRPRLSVVDATAATCE